MDHIDDELYRLIAESSVDYAIFHVGLDGIIRSWNLGAERHGSILFVPEDVFQGVPEREIKFASETGRAQDSRWHLRKNGSRFWANGVMLGSRERTGRLRGLAKIVRDDSGLKQSQEFFQYQLNLADAIDAVSHLRGCDRGHSHQGKKPGAHPGRRVGPLLNRND